MQEVSEIKPRKPNNLISHRIEFLENLFGSKISDSSIFKNLPVFGQVSS